MMSKVLTMCAGCNDEWPADLLNENDSGLCPVCLEGLRPIIPDKDWETYLEEEEDKWWEHQDDHYEELDFNEE